MSIEQPTDGAPWTDPRPMHRLLVEVRQAFGDDGNPAPPQDEVLRALRRLREQGGASGFSARELKYVCHGVATPMDTNRWSVLANPPVLQRLVADVDARQREGATFRRCYQGLLGSYFAYGGDPAGTPAEQGWNLLRGALRERLPTVATATRRNGHQPPWIATLLDHRNLLDESGRCDRYARGFGRDGSAELQTLCDALGIPASSWVWDEALLGWVRAVAAKEDAGFVSGLDDVLALLSGKTAWRRLPERVSVEGTAISVRRYAACRQRPEHPDLRDACLRFIGNPWLQRASWDAWVRDEPARQMVDGWTKREYIRLFFEVLAQDAKTDPRRLEYWLQWADETDDMWFVLGKATRNDPRAEVRELLQHAKSRCSELSGAASHNNAFVMRIGPALLVEFSQSGNACFVHDAAHPVFDLAASTHTIWALRGESRTGKRRLGRLTHHGAWEADFDHALYRHTGRRRGRGDSSRSRVAPFRATPSAAPADSTAARSGPSARRDGASADAARVDWRGSASSRTSAFAPPSPEIAARLTVPAEAATQGDRAAAADYEDRIKAMCDTLGVDWKDNRPKGGAFWVLVPTPVGAEGALRLLTRRLELLGFRHQPGKGYWISGE